MKDITDADYKYSHRVCQDFKKQLGEYHDFYVQSDTLLVPDVFENFQNICLETYGLDPTQFFWHQDQHDLKKY